MDELHRREEQGINEPFPIPGEAPLQPLPESSEVPNGELPITSATQADSLVDVQESSLLHPGWDYPLPTADEWGALTDKTATPYEWAMLIERVESYAKKEHATGIISELEYAALDLTLYNLVTRLEEAITASDLSEPIQGSTLLYLTAKSGLENYTNLLDAGLIKPATIAKLSRQLRALDSSPDRERKAQDRLEALRLGTGRAALRLLTSDTAELLKANPEGARTLHDRVTELVNGLNEQANTSAQNAMVQVTALLAKANALPDIS